MRSDFETIVVSRHEDQILLVTLDRPEVSNALNTRMGLDLTELFETLAIDLAGLRIVIITGSGDKAFCAGGDLKERNGMTDQSWQSQHTIFERMLRAMLGCPLPLLAAVNGAAYGGGCEIAARLRRHPCALCPDRGYARNNAWNGWYPEPGPGCR